MTAAPTVQEIAAETDPVRRAILDAMMRLLDRRPLHVEPGSASVSALAAEAQVKRHWLNGAHKDLRDRYVFLRDRIDAPTVRERELATRLAVAEDEISRLTERMRAVTSDRDNWKTTAEVFLRAMNVQECEIDRRDVEIRRLTGQLDRLRTSASGDELGRRRPRTP